MSIEFDSLSNDYETPHSPHVRSPFIPLEPIYSCRPFCMHAISWLSGEAKEEYKGFGSSTLLPTIRFLAGMIIGELSSLFGTVWHIGKAVYHQFFDHSPDASHKVSQHVKSLIFDAVVATGVGAFIFGAAYAYDPVATKKAELKFKS